MIQGAKARPHRTLTDLQTKEKGPNPGIARWAASQGMVLLENHNQALPLQTKTIALFGGGAYATVKGGTGSGNVSTPYAVTIYEGFLQAGYTITSTPWLEAYGAEYHRVQAEDRTLTEMDRIWTGLTIHVPEPVLTEKDLATASSADTAVYVISRVAGEEKDRRAEKGDYYLSDVERENLRLLAKHFPTTIVILNTCVIDTGFFHEIEGLDAMLLMSLAGMEGGNALVDVLSGAVTPSGKLTDTWALDYYDNPASRTFGQNGGDGGKQVNYTEGLYVGYRYFDSFNIRPAYEFGYGLSYTEFVTEARAVTIDADRVVVQAAVKNRGATYSGKEVVQVYVSTPNGKLDKPYQSLLGFAKTEELHPGETETLTIAFPLAEMASYDEAAAAWVLEAGDYRVRVGNSSRSTRVAAVIRLDETAVTEQLSNRLPLDQSFKDMRSTEEGFYRYPGESEEMATAPVLELRAASIIRKDHASKIDTSVVTTYLTEGADYVSKYRAGSRYANETYIERIEWVRPVPDAKLYDVYSGALSMEEFVAQLDLPVLATLVNGRFSGSEYRLDGKNSIPNAEVTPGAVSGGTTPNYVQSLGIPNNHLPDGPAGLHIPRNELGCTAYPVGMLLAQTWDVNLILEVGRSIGKELLDNQMTVILGPGMNIHRDPLCGRNFEYFSEDPRLTGMVATMLTLGVQSHPGVGVSIKHFIANNQETGRSGGNSSISERALREIYLKGFEIAVKSSQPMTVMTSYNKINGVQTSSSTDLCTHILRGEWGFQGLVMTDWFTVSDNGQDMHAGNDMIMGGEHISKLINAVAAPEPVFAADGYVEVFTLSLFGGYKTEQLEQWNAFLPHSEGRDTCKTVVAADVEVGAKVMELVEQGVASLELQEDGSRTVTYKGTYKEAYTALGDVQKSAMHILNVFLKCWTVRNVYNENTGYEPIPVKPYGSYFGVNPG